MTFNSFFVLLQLPIEDCSAKCASGECNVSDLCSVVFIRIQNEATNSLQISCQPDVRK